MRRYGILGLSLLLIFLSGCPKKPPTDAYKKALEALKQARNAKAAECAKDELKSAERMMKRAQKFMDEGKFEDAKTAFDAAKKLAEKAKEEAKLNKDCGKPKKTTKTTLPTPPTVVTSSETPTADNRQTLKTIYFAFNKYQLTEEAKQTLRQHADWLNSHPNAKIEISGHCDQRGSVEYNLALGEKRALTVKKFLVDLGISPSRISVISYGHQKPADPRYTPEAFAKNRRAEFRITP